MTEQDKQLLLKDLCARVPYKPKVKILHVWNKEKEIEEDIVDTVYCVLPEGHINTETIDSDIPLNDNVILYLRPMSSMTTKERQFLLKFGTVGMDENDKVFDVYPYGMERTMSVIDFLNAHHFDYRGLIEKSLAIIAPEGMYKTE